MLWHYRTPEVDPVHKLCFSHSLATDSLRDLIFNKLRLVSFWQLDFHREISSSFTRILLNNFLYFYRERRSRASYGKAFSSRRVSNHNWIERIESITQHHTIPINLFTDISSLLSSLHFLSVVFDFLRLCGAVNWLCELTASETVCYGTPNTGAGRWA